jgi:hypothetical protein
MSIISNFFKKIEPKNELVFYRQYITYGAYSESNKYKKQKISDIIYYFRKHTNNNGVFIESKFNEFFYPLYDLDNIENLDLFKKLYSKDNYVIFRSSVDHYWVILDSPTKKIDDIFCDTIWKTCNDQKYVMFSSEVNGLFIRGLYENENRKPYIFETNGNLSKNFQLFVDKLTNYYSNEGLELSVLRYKDPDLLIKFNRKTKLKKLQDV